MKKTDALPFDKNVEFQIPCADDAKPDCKPGPIPFRTIIMLASLLLHMAVSSLTHWAFTSGKVGLEWDFFGCYKEG